MLLGCRAPATDVPRADPARPLAAYAGRRVVLLPVQSVDDGAGWGSAAGGAGALRTRMDDELAFALGERGVTSNWILPAALASMTRRAGTYVPDVRALSVEPLRRATKVPEGPLADPLRSELRSLVAFTNARWVLLPIEARIERVAGRQGARVALQLAVIDARGAVVAWIGDVAGEVAAAAGAQAFASAAAKAADLIAPGS